MKRKLFFGLASLAIMAAAVTATLTTINANSNESDLLTKNIEALSRDEGDAKQVKYVDSGSRFIMDDEGNYEYSSWCDCVDEGTLNCPCS